MYDIAIIGCGPVGALAANFLGKQGWKVLVVEREANPYPLPRAVHLDHEMVRLFQDIDLHHTILPDMRDTEGHLHVGSASLNPASSRGSGYLFHPRRSSHLP